MNEIFNFKEKWAGEADYKKKRLVFWITVLVILASAFLVLQSASVATGLRYIGGGIQPTNVVSVSGDGEVFAVPDIAEISFSAHVEKKTVALAQKEVTDTMNAAIDFVKGAGIADKDIKTTGYNAYPKYETQTSGPCSTQYCPPRKQVLSGYEVTHSVLVKVRDTDKVSAILDGLGKLKVTDISGPNFSIDDDNALKAEARKKAISDAKTKADVLAKDLGVRLVRIISFSESGNYPIYYAKTMAFGMGGDAQSAPTPDIPKGENKITSNVTITYEIK
ncbi:MAG: SIMPL domain-containing protein [Candidatus Paceibacterota bacterium]|jgi:hypothetical protein